MKIIASILTLGALSVQADVPTYCNPMSLPGIPVAAGCRNPNPSRAGGASFREIADPSFIFENWASRKRSTFFGRSSDRAEEFLID